MDAKSKEASLAFLRQDRNLRNNQHASVFLIKLNAPGQLEHLDPSTYLCHYIWTFSDIWHSITSYRYIPTTVFWNKDFKNRMDQNMGQGGFGGAFGNLV